MQRSKEAAGVASLKVTDSSSSFCALHRFARAWSL